MSSPQDAYDMHLRDTIGYTGRHRDLHSIDVRKIKDEAATLRGDHGHEYRTIVRRKISAELGISLDAFIGEHGTVDDDALERTVLYIAKKARRLRRKEATTPELESKKSYGLSHPWQGI